MRAGPQRGRGDEHAGADAGGGDQESDVVAAGEGRRIAATGRTVTVLTLPGNGTGSLSQVADEINAVVTRLLHQGAPSVDVIGYSAGGVATLLWAREDDGSKKARRVVTLGSPFHGISHSGFFGNFVGKPGAVLSHTELQKQGNIPLLFNLNN